MRDKRLLKKNMTFELRYRIDSIKNLNLSVIMLIQEGNLVLRHQTSNWSLSATNVFSPIPDTCFSSSMDLNWPLF